VRQPGVRNLLGLLLVVAMLAGCTTTPGPTPAPKTDFTKPGAAADIVNQLMAQIGSTRVVRVRLTATEAEVSVVSGTSVVTYAWRDNQMAAVDTDVQYVGQALFDPRVFNLSNLGDLFTRAAAVAGSAQGQQLQIVDFDSGHIYMTVTTNPETMPVFFFPDGTLVAEFNAANPADLVGVLAAVLPETGDIVRLGIDADGSVYADLPAGPGQVLHVVRSPRFPVRQQLKTDGSGSLPFDPGNGERILTVVEGDILIIGERQFKVAAETINMPFYTQSSIDEVIAWWTDYMDSRLETGNIIVIK